MTRSASRAGWLGLPIAVALWAVSACHDDPSDAVASAAGSADEEPVAVASPVVPPAAPEAIPEPAPPAASEPAPPATPPMNEPPATAMADAGEALRQDRAELLKRAATIRARIADQRASARYAEAAASASDLAAAAAAIDGAESPGSLDARRLRDTLEAWAGMAASDQTILAEGDRLEQSLPELFSACRDEEMRDAATRLVELRTELLPPESHELLRARAWLATASLAGDVLSCRDAPGGMKSRPKVTHPKDVLTLATTSEWGDEGALPVDLDIDELAEIAGAHGASPLMVLMAIEAAHAEGRFLDAKRLVETTMKLTPPPAAVYGPPSERRQHPDRGDTVFDMMVLQGRTHAARANEACRALLAVAASLEPGHPIRADVVGSCARVRLRQARVEDAEVLAREAIRVRLDAAVPDHAGLARDLALEGVLRSMLGRHDEGVEALGLAARVYAAVTRQEIASLDPQRVLEVVGGSLADRVLERAMSAGSPEDAIVEAGDVPFAAPSAPDVETALAPGEAHVDRTLAMFNIMNRIRLWELALPEGTQVTDGQRALLKTGTHLSMLKAMRDAEEGNDFGVVLTAEAIADAIKRLRAELYAGPAPADESGDDAFFTSRLVALDVPGVGDLQRFAEAVGSADGDATWTPRTPLEQIGMLAIARSFMAASDFRELADQARELSRVAEGHFARADFGRAEAGWHAAADLVLSGEGPGRIHMMNEDLLQPVVRLAWLRYARGRYAEARRLYEAAIRVAREPGLGGDGPVRVAWGLEAMEGLIAVHDTTGNRVGAAEARREMADWAVRAGSTPGPGRVARPGGRPIGVPAMSFRPWEGLRAELRELERQEPPAVDAPESEHELTPDQERMLEQVPPELREAMRERLVEMWKKVQAMGAPGGAIASPKTRAGWERRRDELRRSLACLRPDELAAQAEDALHRGEAYGAERLYERAIEALRQRSDGDGEVALDPRSRAMMRMGAGATEASCLAGLSRALEAQGRWSEAAEAWAQSVAARSGDQPTDEPRRESDSKQWWATRTADAARMACLAARTAADEVRPEFAAGRAGRSVAAAEAVCRDALVHFGCPTAYDALVAHVRVPGQDKSDPYEMAVIVEYAHVLEARGLLHDAEGDHESAVGSLHQAAALHEALRSNHPSERIKTDPRLKELEERLKDVPGAPGITAERLLEIAGGGATGFLQMAGLPTVDGHRRDFMQVWFEIGGIERARRQHDRALAAFARSIQEARALKYPGLWRISYAYAELLREVDRPDDAVPLYVEAIGQLEARRAEQVGDEVRRASRGGKRRALASPEAGLVRALLASDSSPEAALRALSASERARGRFLLDLLARSGHDPLTALAMRAARLGDDALARQAEAALEALEAPRAELRRLHADGSDDGDARRHELLARIADAEAAIVQLAAAHLGVPGARSMPWGDIADLLEAGEVVLQYDVGEEGSVVFVAAADEPVEALTLEIDGGPATLGDLTELSRSFLRLAYKGSSLPGSELEVRRREAQVLARTLLPDRVRARLGKASRVLLIPDGPLHLVAFEALPIGEAADAAASTVLWIDRFPPVVRGASATVLVRDRRTPAGRQRAREGLVAVGDPELSDLGPIPRSRREAERIVSMANGAGPPFGPGRMLVGRDATRANLKQAVAGSCFVHLATHGDAKDGDLVTDSCLWLAGEARGADARLTLQELLVDWGGLLEGTELVVLSACRSAQGAEIFGEGLVALPWGFLYTGAKSVVGTLWNVNDEAAGLLMARFYENLTGQYAEARAVARQSVRAGTRMPKSLALAEAKTWLRGHGQDEYSEPYYWAAFALTGHGD